MPKDGEVAAKAKETTGAGDSLIVADLEAPDLLAVADLPEAKDAIIFNVRSSDEASARSSAAQRVPHHAGLGHARRRARPILLWKKWRRWLLLIGKSPPTRNMPPPSAAPPIVSAPRSSRSARTISSPATPHRHRPSADPDADADADARRRHARVVWVADTDEAFGEYVPYRTDEPKPVVGTQGLVAVGLASLLRGICRHADAEPFERFAKRIMTERDYTAWLAVRIVGEAVTRTSQDRLPSAARLHPVRQIRGGRLQGTGHELPPLGPAAAPADPARGRALRSSRSRRRKASCTRRYLTDTLGYDQPEPNAGLRTTCNGNGSKMMKRRSIATLAAPLRFSRRRR